MNGKQAIQAALQSTQHMVKWFVEDFSDADMLVRPVPGANHAAWQIGNVIVADRMLLAEQLPRTAVPELPAGFKEMHGREGASKDGPQGFLKKAEYIELFDRVRGAVIKALDGLSDADLDRPSTGQMAQWAPTLGNIFILLANHAMMHGGQFSVIRRKLGKPVLF